MPAWPPRRVPLAPWAVPGAPPRRAPASRPWTPAGGWGWAGNCAAGGGYATSPGHGQAFVVNQTNGAWGTAQNVPGLAALNQGRSAEIYTVSCASAGNCSAGGFYHDASGRAQGFVVSEK